MEQGPFHRTRLPKPPVTPMARPKTTRRTSSRSTGARKGNSRRPATRRTKAPQPTYDDLEQTQVEELLLQMLETELGGVQVYETAVSVAQEEDLKEEWQKYLEQTRRHVEIVTDLCNQHGVDVDKESPGRQVVRSLGQSLVEAIHAAADAGEPGAAEIVAAECIVMAEFKDHQNWELLKEVTKAFEGEERQAFDDAVDEVEDQEDEHLYHTMGWCRELWLKSLGIAAALPPPEERENVHSAIGAALAKKSRKMMAR